MEKRNLIVIIIVAFFLAALFYIFGSNYTVRSNSSLSSLEQQFYVQGANIQAQQVLNVASNCGGTAVVYVTSSTYGMKCLQK